MVKVAGEDVDGAAQRGGTNIHPMRQPVIEKYLLNDEATTASRDVSHAERDSGGLPSRVANSMPW